VIISIGQAPVADGSAYQLALREHAGETVPVKVERNGQEVVVNLTTPPVTPAETRVETGITPQVDIIYHTVPWWQAVPKGLSDTFNILRQMYDGIVMLIRGEVPLSGIAGPIGMGQLTSEVLEASAAPTWVTLSNLMIVLSLNLAILNMLPIPALDGGRLLFVIIEFLRGKRVSPEKEGIVHFVGIVILFMLMFVVAFVDIDRIASGQSFLR
jgi:regulator of sigma E protease